MAEYIDVPIDSNPDTIASESYDYMQSQFPGWSPHEGSMETVIIDTVSRIGSGTRAVASRVPKSIFRFFGKLVGVAPTIAVKASAQVTWRAIDNLGHTIPAGTQVGIRDEAGELHVYEVIIDTVIPAGQTEVSDITILAIEPGEGSSGIGVFSQQLELVFPLDWVDRIILDVVPTNGVSTETDLEFLNRLTSELQLLAPRPILPNDAAVLARNVAGVFRATAVDGYNPVNDTYFNERYVAVSAQDESGAGVDAATKLAIHDYLEEKRETNFVFPVFDPTVSLIDIVYTAQVLPGYSKPGTRDAINAALKRYLDPTRWGAALNDALAWNPDTLIRFTKIEQVISNVSGVDYIVSCVIGIHGTGLAAADIVLPGAAPLPSLLDANLVGTAV